MTKNLIPHLKFTIYLHDILLVCLPESNVEVLNGQQGSVVNLPDETSKTPYVRCPPAGVSWLAGVGSAQYLLQLDDTRVGADRQHRLHQTIQPRPASGVAVSQC